MRRRGARRLVVLLLSYLVAILILGSRKLFLLLDPKHQYGCANQLRSILLYETYYSLPEPLHLD